MKYHPKSSGNQKAGLEFQITDISLPNRYISYWITMPLEGQRRQESNLLIQYEGDKEWNCGRAASEHGYLA